jgi:hypothetical protein
MRYSVKISTYAASRRLDGKDKTLDSLKDKAEALNFFGQVAKIAKSVE